MILKETLKVLLECGDRDAAWITAKTIGNDSFVVDVKRGFSGWNFGLRNNKNRRIHPSINWPTPDATVKILETSDDKMIFNHFWKG